MFANPKWFKPRLFGWGLGIRRWEGAAYIGVPLALIIGSQFLPLPSEVRLGLLAVVGGFFILDLLSVLPAVYAGLDERERTHQLIAERNASFAGVAAITLYLVYVAASLAAQGATDHSALLTQIGPLVAVALVMSLAKGASLLWLGRSA